MATQTTNTEVKKTTQCGHSQGRIGDYRNQYETGFFGLFIDGEHVGDFKRKKHALLAEELIQSGHIIPTECGVDAGELLTGISKLAEELGGHFNLPEKFVINADRFDDI